MPLTETRVFSAFLGLAGAGPLPLAAKAPAEAMRAIDAISRCRMGSIPSRGIERWRLVDSSAPVSGAVAIGLRVLVFADRRRQRRNRQILIIESHHRPGARHRWRGRPRPSLQADAAVRFGLADVLGRGRAVNPVGRGGEVDPDQTDRIVRTRRDGQLAVWSSPLSTRILDRNGTRDSSRRPAP